MRLPKKEPAFKPKARSAAKEAPVSVSVAQTRGGAPAGDHVVAVDVEGLNVRWWAGRPLSSRKSGCSERFSVPRTPLAAISCQVTVGHRVLLSEAHLKLRPGRYGFIGANGAGKSTLLKLMAEHRIPGSQRRKVQRRQRTQVT